MRVHKCNHLGQRKYSYAGELVTRDAQRAVVSAPWTFDEIALGYIRFAPGDIFTETFYFDRWYNVFEIHQCDMHVKGWYANVTRPARLCGDDLDWDDLALDAWMSADGRLMVLDEDEFAELAPQLTTVEAASARGAIAPLSAELRRRWRAHANDEIAHGLTHRGWTLGTAESCTGGLIGDLITDRPGSSAYFQGGILSYSDEVKRRQLGVRRETLDAHGAVSEACALEMALGVRRALGVDVGISATGIAGPDGGSAGKPVGLTYVAISTPDGEAVSRNVWPHDRAGNKHATADEALRLLSRHAR
jgi:PncC family amidohydrolase